MRLLGEHGQNFDGALSIRLTFLENLRQPVLPVIFTTEFGFVTLLDAVHVFPGVEFLTQGRGAEFQSDVCRHQFFKLCMQQSNLYLNGVGRCSIGIKGLAPPIPIVSGVLAELIVNITDLDSQCSEIQQRL